MAARKDWVDMEQRIVRAIWEMTDAHGHPPTIREIGAAVGLSSTSSVAYRLRAMENRGLIRHTPGTCRTYQLLVEPC